jgi:hypothetical protein
MTQWDLSAAYILDLFTCGKLNNGGCTRTAGDDEHGQTPFAGMPGYVNSDLRGYL